MFEPDEGFALPAVQSKPEDSPFALPDKNLQKPETSGSVDEPVQSATASMKSEVSPFRKVASSGGTREFPSDNTADYGLSGFAEPEPVRRASALESGGYDGAPIQQLELRAIFGVDRELNRDEILERARRLTGVRHLSIVDAADAGFVEQLKTWVGKLGFSGRGMKLVVDGGSIELIREGSVVLAVQTENGFAPGVRETLIIVARELGKL